MMSSDQKTILVIDDDQVIRESIVEIMELMGYAALEAENGEAGIALYHENGDQIGLVFLDLTMPGMSGDLVLAELHRINPEAKVILMSGYNQVETVKRFAHLNMNGFMKKPFDIDTIMTYVTEML